MFHGFGNKKVLCAPIHPFQFAVWLLSRCSTVVVRRTPTLLNLGATWAQNSTHFAPASPVLGLQAIWNHYGFSVYAKVGYFRVIGVALIL
jgi:hypothetical protein